MEKYLTVAELSKIIKLSPGTIRNMVWKKTFVEGKHYIKPTSRKLLFVWSAVESWLWKDYLLPEKEEKGYINI